MLAIPRSTHPVAYIGRGVARITPSTLPVWLATRPSLGLSRITAIMATQSASGRLRAQSAGKIGDRLRRATRGLVISSTACNETGLSCRAEGAPANNAASREWDPLLMRSLGTFMVHQKTLPGLARRSTLSASALNTLTDQCDGSPLVPGPAGAAFGNVVVATLIWPIIMRPRLGVLVPSLAAIAEAQPHRG